MKKNLLFLICFFSTLASFCQDPNFSNISLQTPHTPQSPTSASLGFNSNYPVTTFNALPDISIPLMELPFGEKKMSVGLTYNPNLVKVNAIPSNVGFGWALNAGGVITRTIKGAPDDKSFPCQSGMLKLFHPTLAGTPESDLVYNYIDQLQTTNSCLTSNQLFNLVSTVLRSGGAGGCYKNIPDTEADIFYFNFMGRTGKFIIKNTGNENYEFRQIPYSNLKFEVRFANSYPIDWGGPIQENGHGHYRQLIVGFTVTDEFGVKYYFDAVEKTESRISSTPYYLNELHQFSVGGDGFSTANTAWNLTKVVQPDNEELVFLYESEIFKYITPTQNTFRNCPDGACENSSLASTQRSFNYPQRAFANSGHKIYSNRIKEITSKEGKIVFNYGQDRLDFGGTKALTGLQLVNRENEIVKKSELQYTYLQCVENTGNNNQLGLPYLAESYENNNTLNKRLMLASISDVSIDGNLKIQSSQFDYNNQQLYPVRGSFQQDFWGFFNNNSAQTLVPYQYIYPAFNGPNRYRVFPLLNYQGPSFFLPGANRFANENAITTAMLKKITYGTGGFSEFKFEPHEFLFDGNQNIKGGGVRIKQIIKNDGISENNNLILNYSYDESEIGHPENSSGRLLSLPSFAYVENTLSYNVSTNNGAGRFDIYPTQNAYDINLYKYFLARNTFPTETLNGYDGVQVAYKYVAEHQNNNGKTIYKFSMPGKYGEVNDFASTDPEQNPNCALTEDGYCDNLFEVSNTYYCEAPAYHINCSYPIDLRRQQLDADNTAMSLYKAYVYPFAANLNYDWNRGHLLTKKVYSNSGIKISEDNIKYENFTPNGVGPRYMNCALIKSYQDWKLEDNGVNGDVMYFSKYKIISDIVKLPKENKHTYFDNNGNQVDKITQFTYHNAMPIRKEINEHVNNGATLKYNYQYAYDLRGSYPFNAMYDQNQIYDLVKVEERKNQLLKKTTEKTFVKPSNLFSYYTADKIKEIQHNDTRTTYTSSSFTSFGSVNEFIEKDEIKTSLIYDNLEVYPIAVVKNAAINDIAFTSFENAEIGNWNFSIASTTSGTSITGKKAYNLTGTISKTGLTPNKQYIVSYWRNLNTGPYTVSGSLVIDGYPRTGQTVGIWTLYEHKVSGMSTVQISGSGLIDEVRLYPIGAFMKSFTNKSLVGLTSQCDDQNRISYYEYDDFNRLTIIRDQDKNIVKRICYKYSNQIGSCDEKVYAKLFVENVNPLGYETYADIIVRFYSDLQCTIPTSVSNLTINFRRLTSSNDININGNSQNFTTTATGLSKLLVAGAEIYATDGGVWYSNGYSIEPGNYIIVN